MDALCITISFSFRYALAHPSIPSRWEGKKYRLFNDLFPLPTGGGEGVGDPIQPSLCSSTDALSDLPLSPRSESCNNPLSIRG